MVVAVLAGRTWPREPPLSFMPAHARVPCPHRVPPPPPHPSHPQGLHHAPGGTQPAFQVRGHYPHHAADRYACAPRVPLLHACSICCWQGRTALQLLASANHWAHQVVHVHLTGGARASSCGVCRRGTAHGGGLLLGWQQRWAAHHSLGKQEHVRHHHRVRICAVKFTGLCFAQRRPQKAMTWREPHCRCTLGVSVSALHAPIINTVQGGL